MKVIVKDVNNMTEQELAARQAQEAEWESGADEREWRSIRQQRDGLLKDTQWIMDRHSEQVAHGIKPSLTDKQVKAFAEYRQSLRDLPQSVGNPDKVKWPKNPLEE